MRIQFIPKGTSVCQCSHSLTQRPTKTKNCKWDSHAHKPFSASNYPFSKWNRPHVYNTNIHQWRSRCIKKTLTLRGKKPKSFAFECLPWIQENTLSKSDIEGEARKQPMRKEGTGAELRTTVQASLGERRAGKRHKPELVRQTELALTEVGSSSGNEKMRPWYCCWILETILEPPNAFPCFSSSCLILSYPSHMTNRKATVKLCLGLCI